MIDWDRLNTLRADIGEEDFADVAAMFISEITEHLDGMQAAPQNVTSADFHFLRGSAANLGFSALDRACTEAEKACFDKQSPDIDRVAGIFDQSLQAVAAHLPGIDRAA